MVYKRKLQVNAMSKVRAEELRTHLAYILISIRNPGENAIGLHLQQERRDVLYLQFDDADVEGFLHDPSGKGKRITLFNKDMANKIFDFTEKWKDKIDLMAVHCKLGISRSAGIAGALAKVYLKDDSRFFKYPYVPNMIAYRIMLNVAEERKLI